MSTHSEPDLISREAWPACGIERYRRIEDGPWGYLLVYADGSFRFQTEPAPSREEILQRWAGYLAGAGDQA